MNNTVQTKTNNRARRLHQRPILAIVLVLVLYLMTEVISEISAGSLIGSSEGVGIFVKLGFFLLLVFIIIPRMLKLPLGKISFSEYLEVIGLRIQIPIGRILILAFSGYFIFAVCQLCGSLIYHSTQPSEYIFDLSKHSLLGTGSIIPGIFEEILFRGVIVTILMGVFSKFRTVVISAIIFGGIHLLNLANPGYSTVWVLAQATWAFGLGLMYAYLFITTRTIWPPIVIHYFINGMVGVWLQGLGGQDLTSALWGIPFFGLLPAGLTILWGHYLWKRWEAANQVLSKS